MREADEVRERIERLEIPFGDFGVDPYGVTKKDLQWSLTALAVASRRYFRLKAHGTENIPARGRAMLIGNHSGGIALDASMVIASAFLDLEPPRLAQALIEKFISRMPFGGTLTSRTGHFPGTPEMAVRLLEDDRLVLVFPEGARGTAKLFTERHSLVDFGTGFMRLAMQTHTPIIPFGFIGGGEAIPTVFNAYRLGKMLGVPYLPFTPWGAPLPLPVSLAVVYGAPLHFEGTGREDDAVIAANVEKVKQAVATLIERGRADRGGLAGVFS